ncbi:MAG: Ig-like domain-containing protein, partial [Lachnospiraceae bacterium]|nr:Ig-like domain-containing protein [Lachnospiraceae bacterium]
LARIYGSSYDKVKDIVADAIGNWDGSRSITADIHGYPVSAKDAGYILVDVINCHPEFFYVDGTYTCSYDTSGMADSIEIAIRDGYTIQDEAAFDNKVREILKGIDKSWTDLQKTIYIHDYLVTHVQYDLSYSRYSAEDAIVHGSAVCMGYSLAFEYLMNKVAGRFNCTYVRSGRLNHAWNYLTISGKQYYVDCTWDDPVSGDGHFYEYHCEHNDFLLSRDGLHKSHNSTDWEDWNGNDVYSIIKGAKDYENAPWVGMDSPVPMIGNTGGYFKSDDYGNVHVFTYDFKTTEKKELAEYEARSAWKDSDWWMNSFTSMSSVGNYFTATTAYDIILINTANGSMRTIYTLSDAEKAQGFIFGAQVKDGILTYHVYANYGSTRKASGRLDLSAFDNKGIAVLLDKYEIDLGINETASISAEVIPEETENKQVIFKSADPSIATVDSTGQVRGISEGDTAIEVSSVEGGKSASCRINVRSDNTKTYTVSFVNNGSAVKTVQVKEGKTVDVKDLPKEDPKGATPFTGWYLDNKTLWNSLMPVTKDLTLTAGFAPAAEPQQPFSGLDTALPSKNGEKFYLVNGQTYDLDENFRWTSEDPKILQVVKKKKLKAKQVTEGTTVTGTPLSGEGGEITVNMIVIAPLLQKNASVPVGETVALDLDLAGYDSHCNVAWFSSNPGVASVCDGKVLGCRKGSCRITAYVNGRALNSTVKVIEKKNFTPIDKDIVTVEPFSTVALKFADGFKLKNAVYSSSLPMKTVKDSSKKVIAYQNSVVRIGKDGKLKAVGTGLVKVTAATSEGEKTFTVYVPQPAARTYFLQPKKSAAVSILGTAPAKMAWSSTDESVAKIRQGKIKTGENPGKATISGNYNPYKNEHGFDYTVNVYTEKPVFELEGEGQLDVTNKAGTRYDLNVKEGTVCRIKSVDTFEPVLFMSKNNTIAFADENGCVYARSAGAETASTKLTAKIAGKTYTINIRVNK